MQIWGDKWASRFESDKDMEACRVQWGEALVVLSADEIERGLSVCRSTMQWPPSIAEFIAAGRSVRRMGAHRLYLPALPKPVNREIAFAELSKIRMAL